MKSHDLAERVARLQHDLVILSMSNLSEKRLHEMLDAISDQVATYAEEAEKHYPKEKKIKG
jgi:predicted RNA-binding protein Jag